MIRFPFIIGVTGSVASGKSFVTSCFKRLRVPVFDADKIVHHMLKPGGKGAAAVCKAFPEVCSAGRVDRLLLGEKVFGDAHLLKHLERVLHPLVWKEKALFLAAARRRRQAIVVLDIPLLFETEAHKACDVVVVTSARSTIEEYRALRRKGMTKEKYHAITALQWPAEKKKEHADIIIDTGCSKATTFYNICFLVRQIKGFYPKHSKN